MNLHLKSDENTKENLEEYIAIFKKKSNKTGGNVIKDQEIDDYWILPTKNDEISDQIECFPLKNQVFLNTNGGFLDKKGEILDKKLILSAKDEEISLKNPIKSRIKKHDKTLEALFPNEFQTFLLKKQEFPDREISEKTGLFGFGSQSFKDISSRFFYANNWYNIDEKLEKIVKGYEDLRRFEGIQAKTRFPVVFSEKNKRNTIRNNEEFIKIEENQLDEKRLKWNEERRKSLELLMRFLSK